MGEVFLNIALDLPIYKLFTYKAPENLISEIEIGKRVLVNFSGKILTGFIVGIIRNTSLKNIKEIKSVLDSERLIVAEYIEFCNWLSQYYIQPIGEFIFSSIPSKINLKTDRYYVLNKNYIEYLDKANLKNDFYIKILELFKSTEYQLTKKQIENKLRTSDITSYLKTLKDMYILNSFNKFSRISGEKTIKLIIRNFEISDYDNIIENIKSDNQKKILKLILENETIEQNALGKKFKSAYQAINALQKKNLIKIEEVRKYRGFKSLLKETQNIITYNKEQIEVVSVIQNAVDIEKFSAFLLFGVTGSGKTEVYMQIIKNVLEKNKTAIVLVPEISLTPQLIHRFQERFGDLIGVIHSKLSEGQKLDTFDKILDGSIKIVIGARSALFAPLRNIGIIIVDEEHDSSYKQNSSPRYNARDAAIVRAKLNNAVVVLGSATPSIESFHNASNGKYKLLTIMKRASDIKLPEVKILDLNESKRKNEIDAGDDFLAVIDKIRVRFLSKELIYKIAEKLHKNEGIILLQNRRGYHSYLECIDCGNVEMCPRCSVSLTYHKTFNYLKCHYCGFNKSVITKCSNCSSTRIINKGAGTEKVEEEISKLFPDAIMKRVDSDIIKSDKRYQEILRDFYNGRINILVGTQMISKGLDFPNVTLVGIINADIGLLNPDFRATEKTFQILTQVSGRSGRSFLEGEVLIQTHHSEYNVFNYVMNHDYLNFYKNEIINREKAKYPPFCRMALIELKAKNKILCESKIKELYNVIKSRDKQNILELLPPGPPLFSKLKDFYRFHLLIKSFKSKDISGKYLINSLNIAKDYSEKNFPNTVRMIIDMDAIEML